MDGSVVRRVAGECAGFLDPAVGEGWASTPIPSMDWTVAQTVAHIGDTLLWYATDLAAGDRELSTMDVRVRPESPPKDLVATVRSFATVLAHVVDGTAPDARGWHPYGLADPSGFAAMGCDELLIHTADAAAGLGLRFRPSDDLTTATLHRLFPWAPAGLDPWDTLLWANGRTPLPDHPRQTHWKWHCAPLTEWDGANPASDGAADRVTR